MANKQSRRRPWIQVLDRALSPFPQLDGLLGRVVGLGSVGIVVAVLVNRYQWRSFWPIAALFAGLLFWAAVRIQRSLSAKEADQGFLEALGRDLTFGQYALDDIEAAGSEYLLAVAEVKAKVDAAAKGLSEAEAAELDEQLHIIMDKPGELKWRQGVTQSLNAKLPHYYSALFDSLAGLSPAQAPERLRTDTHWRQRWVEQEMRLQRLHAIIEELHKEWRPKWSQ